MPVPKSSIAMRIRAPELPHRRHARFEITNQRRPSVSRDSHRARDKAGFEQDLNVTPGQFRIGMFHGRNVYRRPDNGTVHVATSRPAFLNPIADLQYLAALLAIRELMKAQSRHQRVGCCFQRINAFESGVLKHSPLRLLRCLEYTAPQNSRAQFAKRRSFRCDVREPRHPSLLEEAIGVAAFGLGSVEGGVGVLISVCRSAPSSVQIAMPMLVEMLLVSRVYRLSYARFQNGLGKPAGRRGI